MAEKNNREAEELRERNERLEAENLKLKKMYANQKDQNLDLMEQNDSLVKEKLNLKLENTGLTEMHESLNAENQRLKNRILRIESREQELKDESQKLKHENLALAEVNSRMRDENAGLEEKRERLLLQGKTLDNENQKLKDRIVELEDKNENLEFENERLTNKLSMLTQKQMSLQKKNEGLERKHKSLQAEYGKMQEENAELAEKCRNLETESGRLQKGHAELAAEYDKLNKQIAEKENDIYAALHQELKDLVETAHEIHNRCYDEIKNCYETEDMVTLPVDIQEVAENLGIDIEFDNLNFADQKRIDQNIAQLYYYKISDDAVKKKIIVDNSISGKKSGPLSNLEKYAVAYELGKVIVGNERQTDPSKVRKLNLESRPYSLPRLSARLQNFEYEMCAIFLLLPMKLFFAEFKNFLEEIKDHPVLMEQWIEHLSMKADIPSYQLINGYQYIKFSAYDYYEKHLSKRRAVHPGKKEYRELYNV